MSPSAPRTLGLVAGLGVGAAVFYYRSLVAAHLERGLAPRILMVHADVRRTMSLAQERRVDELAAYLAGLLAPLAAGGCDIATIPAFSPQVCARQLAELSPLPLIGLVETAVAEVKRRRFARIAVFGARVTMETKLFGALSDQVEVFVPPLPDLDLVSESYKRIVEREAATGADLAERQSRRRGPRRVVRGVRQPHPRVRGPGGRAAELGHGRRHIPLAGTRVGRLPGGPESRVAGRGLVSDTDA